MAQEGAGRFRRFERDDGPSPPSGGVPLPPSGSAPSPRSGASPLPRTGQAPFSTGRGATPPPVIAFDPVGEILASDNRAAARAAIADRFAAQFGVDELGPSAAALADRFGFRYENTDGSTAVSTGRRTVTITGRGAGRAVPPAERTVGVRGGAHRAGAGSGRAAARRISTMPELRADRIALWAVALGLLLAFVAVTSAHAAILGELVAGH